MKKKAKVFVGVSGGVDSSVSLVLLKDQGYDVTGVFIRTWTPDFIQCSWKDERRDAIRVCAHIGVPFLECDAIEAYKKGVADYMIEEYKSGRTPNPDVFCNREVKFGVFWEFAKSRGADFIATGHYARIGKKLKVESKKSDTNLHLLKGIDSEKDQSYFLWKLNQNDLSHTIFPVGRFKKSHVRKLAEKYKLPTMVKKDSQGVCFLGPLDIKEFLSHYIKTDKGNVLNEEGKIIGQHNGSVYLTIGERHGFTITEKTNIDSPYYVVGKDINKNTVTVSKNIKKFEKIPEVFTLNDCNFTTDISDTKKIYTCQTRYHQKLLRCSVKLLKGNMAEVSFIGSGTLVSPGQSLVLYNGEICVGGGTIM